MPNQNERPKYTDPDHPYSGSGPRYQNNYSRNDVDYCRCVKT